MCHFAGKTCWSNECWTVCCPAHGVLVCWTAVSLNYIWAHFQGIYCGCQQWDRCVSWCACVSPINKAQGHPSLSHRSSRKMMRRCSEYTHSLQTHTLVFTGSQVQSSVRVIGLYFDFTERQTFHSLFESINPVYYILVLFFFFFRTLMSVSLITDRNGQPNCWNVVTQKRCYDKVWEGSKK